MPHSEMHPTVQCSVRQTQGTSSPSSIDAVGGYGRFRKGTSDHVEHEGRTPETSDGFGPEFSRMAEKVNHMAA